MHVTTASEAVASGAAVQAASVLLGSSIQQVRDAWAPDFEVISRPRDGGSIDEVIARYASTAGFAAHLGSGA